MTIQNLYNKIQELEQTKSILIVMCGKMQQKETREALYYANLLIELSVKRAKKEAMNIIINPKPAVKTII